VVLAASLRCVKTRMVERRWAMTKLVLPSISRAIAVWDAQVYHWQSQENSLLFRRAKT